MRKIKSCGIILFSSSKYQQFLLLKHSNRYDLPKGHLENGETELSCAKRELFEETEIADDAIMIDKEFRFEQSYTTQYKRFNNDLVEKTLVIFLAFLSKPKEIILSEHNNFEWVELNDDLQFEEKTINSLLFSLKEYFLKNS